MPELTELTLTSDERETLERWARRPTTAQALAQRARMILACADGRPNDHVARRERVTRQTVGRWRARSVSKRSSGVAGAARRTRAKEVSRGGVHGALLAGKAIAPLTAWWTQRDDRARAMWTPPNGVGRRVEEDERGGTA
jgi:hypothetical protein